MTKLIVLISAIIILDNISGAMILYKFSERKCKLIAILCIILSLIFIFTALAITKRCPECGKISTDYSRCPRCGYKL